MDSQLGSLHAANASSSAFAHANAKSRVGRLAAYMDAMVVYTEAFEAADWESYDSLMDEYDALVAETEALAAALEGLTEDTPTYDNKLAELESKQAEADAKLAEADAVIADVTAAQEDAAGNLAGAANKDGLIDGDVVHAVNEMLDGKSDGFSHETLDGDVTHDSESAIAGTINPPVE
jgi:chromosome segregation ATPase